MEQIERIIKQHELGSVTGIKSANEFGSIGSDGIILTETTEGKFIIKLMHPPEKLEARLKYHKAVAPFLPVPEIVCHGNDYIVFKFVEGMSLLGKTMEDPKNVLPYYKHAFELLAEYWQKSEGENTGLRNCSELEGAEEAIQKLMQGREDMPTAINGGCSKLTLHEVFHSLLDWLKKCPTSCFAHGDARTDNIIVNPNGKGGIAFIDMRPGFCWMDDLVLLGWLDNFRFVNFIETPHIRSMGQILEINFRTSTSPLQREVHNLSMKTLQQVAIEQKIKGWKRDYHYTLAASAICEMAGVQKRKDLGVLDRDLPPNVEYFWIATAIQNYRIAIE